MPTAGFQVDGTDAQGVDLEALAQMVSAGASPPTEQLVRALWGVGSLTLLVDVSAALNHGATGPVFSGHKVAYYSTLAGVLGVVALEMATAYWLPRRAGAQLASFAKALLRFAVLLLLVLVAMGGYALTVKV